MHMSQHMPCTVLEAAKHQTNKGIMIKRSQSSVVGDVRERVVGVLDVGTEERLSGGMF